MKYALSGIFVFIYSVNIQQLLRKENNKSPRLGRLQGVPDDMALHLMGSMRRIPLSGRPELDSSITDTCETPAAGRNVLFCLGFESQTL